MKFLFLATLAFVSATANAVEFRKVVLHREVSRSLFDPELISKMTTEYNLKLQEHCFLIPFSEQVEDQLNALTEGKAYACQIKASAYEGVASRCERVIYAVKDCAPCKVKARECLPEDAAL